ncbi:Alcohol dehydrogenase, class V [Phaffia rhodozyma]|uniref:Alcohol dehydrogenase, class V n=1 Tax=Phaffia rhodozyma TaxID=264483 RepID=A0A0F7SPS3_PHARH|nr:Alcohol dehydrogenase, class V [Phaffia rhodozyma]
MTAQGAIHDTKNWTDFKLIEYPLKTAEDHDIDVNIENCGVCGSDVHTITGGWGDVMLPAVVGHEIIGRVTKVGPKASSEFKVGQLVGVGAQVGSCTKCPDCTANNEQYCSHGVFTYNHKYPNGDRTMGGYADKIRVHENFVFAIPEGIEGKHAAPLMCAGLTVYSPLVRNGCGPGKKVGIVGIGGLGHIALQFAAALGAEVYALTHSLKKKDDILKMGVADEEHIIVTNGEENFQDKFYHQLDLILSTVDNTEGLPLDKLARILVVNGRLVTVGLPSGDATLPIHARSFMGNGCLFSSSLLGSKKEANEMLELAAAKGVKPWIQELNMSQAGEAVQGLYDGKVRYRYVLHNDIPKKN